MRGLRFRSVLLFALTGVPVITVAIIALVSYINVTFIVNDLSSRLLRQTSLRIHDQLRGLLDTADNVSDAGEELLAGYEKTPENLLTLSDALYWVLRASDELSYISVSLTDGSYAHVQRLPRPQPADPPPPHPGRWDGQGYRLPPGRGPVARAR